MNPQKMTFADRLKASTAAKQALVAKFKPKPMQTDPNFADRAAERAAEVERVRLARAEAKAAKEQARVDAAEAAALAKAQAEEADLEANRGARRERKALSAAEAKAKRDAKYAARKARN